MEKRNKNKKSGFTLIELVVVIAIIGVLAAVITPRVRLSLAKAKDAKAIATLDALRTASNVYYAETGNAIGTKDAVVKTAEIKLLGDGGYLEKGVEGKFTSDNTLGALIEAGGVNNPNCTNATATANAKISFKFQEDGVGIDVATAGGDTSCKLWSEK